MEPFFFENVDSLWLSLVLVRLLIYRSVLVCLGCHNKTPQVGWLKQQTFISSQGSWKSKIKVSAGLVSPESSLLGLQMATFSLAVSSHGLFSVCTPLVSFLLTRTPVWLDQGPTL